MPAQPPAPPPDSSAHGVAALVDLVRRLPPWLPPVLWIMGGGTIGVGGMEIAHGPRDDIDGAPTCDCDELRDQLDGMQSVVQRLATECDGAGESLERPRAFADEPEP